MYIDPSNPSYYWVNTEYITSLPPRTYTTLPATVLAMSTSDLIKYQQNSTALIQLMQSHWLPVELRNTQTQIPPEAVTMFKHMLDTEIKKRQS
ncbi:MAG: hypothetical protein Q4B28_04625 [bacterium]|nr:hypothetical protein [bacterium]